MPWNHCQLVHIQLNFVFIWKRIPNSTSWSHYPAERSGTTITGGWVSPRAGLDGCEKSCPNRDSNPEPSRIPTTKKLQNRNINWCRILYKQKIRCIKTSYNLAKRRTNWSHVTIVTAGCCTDGKVAGVVQVATQFSTKFKKALSYTSIPPPPHIFMVCKRTILIDLTKINVGNETVPSDKITVSNRAYHTQGL